MLLELRIENLLLIERAELRPGPGLNAITGETGAGKTVLAHALDLLLGGKPRQGSSGLAPPRPTSRACSSCRTACSTPTASRTCASASATVRRARSSSPAGVSAEGRTRAYVQGRSATAADLRELGGRLVAFFGQHEHRKLTVSAAQLELLDGFCGPDQLALRDQVAGGHARVGRRERALDDLRDRAGTRERDLDLLAFELAEIDELEPDEDEEHAALLAERERLRQVDVLRAAAARGGARRSRPTTARAAAAA